jgi:hypothetical protein
MRERDPRIKSAAANQIADAFDSLSDAQNETIAWHKQRVEVLEGDVKFLIDHLNEHEDNLRDTEYTLERAIDVLELAVRPRKIVRGPNGKITHIVTMESSE